MKGLHSLQAWAQQPSQRLKEVKNQEAADLPMNAAQEFQTSCDPAPHPPLSGSWPLPLGAPSIFTARQVAYTADWRQ